MFKTYQIVVVVEWLNVLHTYHIDQPKQPKYNMQTPNNLQMIDNNIIHHNHNNPN